MEQTQNTRKEEKVCTVRGRRKKKRRKRRKEEREAGQRKRKKRKEEVVCDRRQVGRFPGKRCRVSEEEDRHTHTYIYRLSVSGVSIKRFPVRTLDEEKEARNFLSTVPCSALYDYQTCQLPSLVVLLLSFCSPVAAPLRLLLPDHHLLIRVARIEEMQRQCLADAIPAGREQARLTGKRSLGGPRERREREGW